VNRHRAEKCESPEAPACIEEWQTRGRPGTRASTGWWRRRKLTLRPTHGDRPQINCYYCALQPASCLIASALCMH